MNSILYYFTLYASYFFILNSRFIILIVVRISRVVVVVVFLVILDYFVLYKSNRNLTEIYRLLNSRRPTISAPLEKIKKLKCV